MHIKEKLLGLYDPLYGVAQQALDLILPPRCFSCGVSVATQGQLCATCWNGLNFITDPQCECCGLPFEYEHLEGLRCGSCQSRPPAYEQARAAFHYDDGSRSLILSFKHGDRTATAKALAQWMNRAVAPIIEDDMLIVPVPLHRWRLLKRRYNQSALLAQQIARDFECAYEPLLLYRKKATASQGGLSASARRANVKQAFALYEKAKDRLMGRSVLLVDDVLTTGATVEACADILKKAGARHVKVVTAARVVTPQIQAI